MYMPAGVFIANGASYRGKGVVLAVKVDPTETAEQLRTSLRALVAQNPKQAPFGCIEHREEDASVWASDFVARETGVYLVAKPSSLGESHVNGQIHRGWSPSFTTDAEYDKAVLKGNVLYFPEGVRGSVSNPARVTGTGFCVGTLTNKPAIKNLDPVTASEFVDPDVTVQGVPAPGPVTQSSGARVMASADSSETPKSSTQLTLPPNEATPFVVFAKQIPASDVYEEGDKYGVETEPHITVLYGLTEHVAEPVVQAVAKSGPVEVTLGKISVFECEKYDVLKVEASGKGLLDLRSKVEKLPNEQTHKDYCPHLTLAYLKKGAGAKYSGDTRFQGRKLVFDSMTFSPPKELRGTTGKPEILLASDVLSIDAIFAKLTPIVTSESVWARVTKISPGGGPTGKPAA